MWASGGSGGGLTIVLHVVRVSTVPRAARLHDIVLACRYIVLAFSYIHPRAFYLIIWQ